MTAAIATPAPPRAASSTGFVLFAGLAAFAAYSSMYAFRKPFTAATYADAGLWEGLIDFKSALVIAQLLGYALSKFAGVKILSELPPTRRGIAIIGLIGGAWLALVLFAVLPGPWKVVALFLNGLPLGLIWGLVFGYLEGRRTSEILAAMLCASFILASGVVKSAGSWLMTSGGISEYWMPAATGVLFMPLLLVSVAGLARMPPPTPEDIAARVARPPMFAAQRRAFLAAYGPGIAALVLAYVVFTVLRDFRDNFAAEIWTALGFAKVSSVFALSELPIAAVTLTMLASLVLVRDNRACVLIAHAIVLAGAILVAGSTAAFQLGLLGPLGWMILSGLGLYFAYTPFNALLFDRLVAASGRAGTAAFLIYVADAAGYVGSVGLLVLRNLPGFTLDWLNLYVALAYAGSAIAAVLLVRSAFFFRTALDRRP